MDGELDSSGSSEATGTETPDTNVSDSGDNVSTGNEAQAGGGESSGDEGEQGNEASPFVKDDDGKEWISKEAFEARISKLSAQKNEARTILDSIRTDPNIRKEFLDSLNLEGERSTPPNEPKGPSLFEKWLSPLPPEHQAHYKGMVEAIGSEFTEFVANQIEEAMKPVRAFIGEQKVNSFSKATPDFGKYQKTVAQIIMDGRAKSMEDAYKIASFEDRVRNASQAGAKTEATRREKLTRSPVAGRSQSAMQVTGSKPNNLKAALAKAASDVGWGNQ